MVLNPNAAIAGQPATIADKWESTLDWYTEVVSTTTKQILLGLLQSQPNASMLLFQQMNLNKCCLHGLPTEEGFQEW
jgi:hypothetical protein